MRCSRPTSLARQWGIWLYRRLWAAAGGQLYKRNSPSRFKPPSYNENHRPTFASEYNADPTMIRRDALGRKTGMAGVDEDGTCTCSIYPDNCLRLVGCMHRPRIASMTINVTPNTLSVLESQLYTSGTGTAMWERTVRIMHISRSMATFHELTVS